MTNEHLQEIRREYDAAGMRADQKEDAQPNMALAVLADIAISLREISEELGAIRADAEHRSGI